MKDDFDMDLSKLNHRVKVPDNFLQGVRRKIRQEEVSRGQTRAEMGPPQGFWQVIRQMMVPVAAGVTVLLIGAVIFVTTERPVPQAPAAPMMVQELAPALPVTKQEVAVQPTETLVVTFEEASAEAPAESDGEIRPEASALSSSEPVTFNVQKLVETGLTRAQARQRIEDVVRLNQGTLLPAPVLDGRTDTHIGGGAEVVLVEIPVQNTNQFLNMLARQAPAVSSPRAAESAIAKGVMGVQGTAKRSVGPVQGGLADGTNAAATNAAKTVIQIELSPRTSRERKP